MKQMHTKTTPLCIYQVQKIIKTKANETNAHKNKNIMHLFVSSLVVLVRVHCPSYYYFPSVGDSHEKLFSSTKQSFVLSRQDNAALRWGTCI